jgi:phosphatidylinositol N-acetylglucosaminyltransferase subunit C
VSSKALPIKLQSSCLIYCRFPASLSTNAALMASTVLASRLPSTTHVFSLTLFSIEVFGLFPVFRRHLRHVSWRGHILLAGLLVVGAGGCLGVTLAPAGDSVWKAGALGGLMMGLGTAVAMGGCSWWLIGLQKYKNEIHGPWDPARPVIKRHWD